MSPLQFQGIEWNAGTLQMLRPETGVSSVFTLLPVVGRVLTRYLRHGRPVNTSTRQVFEVSAQMKVPFGPLDNCSAVRHILGKHAKTGAIQAASLGSHVLRHSNAARLVEPDL